MRMNIANSKAPVLKVTNLGPATALNYQLSLKGAERAYRKADADDKKVISGMVSDCEFAIEWLSTGRRPGNKRGIERRAGYERDTIGSDPYAGVCQQLKSWQPGEFVG